jgi:hypothetical protein
MVSMVKMEINSTVCLESEGNVHWHSEDNVYDRALRLA